MLLIKRTLAQMIDIFMYFFILVLFVKAVLPIGERFTGQSNLLGLLVFAVPIALYLALQSLFYTNRQTIGKAFFRLKVKSEDSATTVDMRLMFVREIFLKLMTCYFTCVPIFFGKSGLHEAATKTTLSME